MKDLIPGSSEIVCATFDGIYMSYSRKFNTTTVPVTVNNSPYHRDQPDQGTSEEIEALKELYNPIELNRGRALPGDYWTD